MLNGGFNATEDVFYLPATLVTYNEVICPLPSQESYFVSVTNDNSTLSEPALLTVYDKQCHECTKSGMCRFKVSAFFIHISEFFCRIQWTIQSRHVFAWFLQEQKCFIENVCYDIGALNPSNSSLFCNPYENFEEWSIKRGKSSEKDDFLISYIRDKNLLIIRACINSADNQHN